MSLNENDGPPQRPAPIPELLESYRTQRVRLAAQTRELERLRDEVRSSAEREAAAIVTAARRNVRQVLLDARRELLVLAAQLQAVGCDVPAGDRNVVQGEVAPAALVAAEPAAAHGADATGNTRAMVVDARRDVREVLVEAQSELMALSEEAKALRARLAGRHAAHHAAPEEPAPAPLPEAETLAAATEPPHYSSLPSTWRVWMSVAAAVVFAALGAAAIFLSRDREPATTAAGASEAAAPAATAGLAPEPAIAPVAAAAPAADPSTVSLAIDIRRPAWIRTTVDGRADVGRLYAAGETKRIGGAREIVMRVGDAGAVFVSLNGAEARALGRDGVVVTRRFAARLPAVQKAAADLPASPVERQVEEPGRAAAANAGTLQPAAPPVPADVAPNDVGTTGAAETELPSRAAADGLVPPESSSAPSAEREILRATQRWFEAFFGGDRAGMAEVATDDFALTDQRTPQAAGATDVDRSMQQVRIEVAGDGAVLSARLTERVTIEGQVRQYVSLVSGVWIRKDGRWRLMAVRFVDPGTLGIQQ